MREHDILQIKSGATKDEIKAAYRKLVMIHHPDKGGDAKKFKEIQEAYEYLLKQPDYIKENPFSQYYSTTAGHNFRQQMYDFQQQMNQQTQANLNDWADQIIADTAFASIKIIVDKLTPVQKLKLSFKIKLNNLWK